MELIEREFFSTSLQTQFDKIKQGEGHIGFICGEAGIGKTSLVKWFCAQQRDQFPIYIGTCDALFAPRPLAPLYDVALQMGDPVLENGQTIDDRAGLFTHFFQALGQPDQPVILVFEDIHWADEATLDFIKFFARRISLTACFFLLTYRDNEIQARHPLRNVLGELIPGSFTRLSLPSLSRQAVDTLAKQKGYRGEDVYSISGGNPFYVREILASYSPGIPETIKDSILLVYNRQEGMTKHVWEILSILPTGLEVDYLEKVDAEAETALENSLASGILRLQDSRVLFKHELYRRTIEQALSPLKRIALNKQILHLFRQQFEAKHQIERIIHHAKHANDYELVVQYAPIAASQAASVGAHIEAAKLYLSAIDYYQGSNKEVMLPWYEAYAYECYLTNQIKEAIIYQGKVLASYRHQTDSLQVGKSLRFLSRLWWFDGNRQQAEKYALEAIAVLEPELASSIKAMAYSNLSQLNMLSDHTDDCLYWGNKAITMARDLGDEETLAHALNNVGAAQARYPASRETGIAQLRQSLVISLKNNYHEHAARAYTNLSSNLVMMKEFAEAKPVLEEGIAFCEERDLNSWAKYMLGTYARLHLEVGNWAEAERMASSLLENDQETAIIKIGALVVLATIRMRTSEADVLPLLLEAQAKAFVTQELQRIIPVLVALLEYEWLTDTVVIQPAAIEQTIQLIHQTDHVVQNSEFVYWLAKVRNQSVPLPAVFAGYDLSTQKARHQAAAGWGLTGCPYQQALLLFDGTDAEKRQAITLAHTLGARVVYEKMKQAMHTSGIKHIPRGLRQSTLGNPAQLTTRELAVLQLLRQQHQNKEIANQLFISAKTVDHHISSILLKLAVHSRGKAVQEAVRLGILK